MAIASTWVPLPGVAGLLDGLGDSPSLRATLSVGAIGLGPVLLAFALVEIAALLVPGWRPLRLSGRDGRARLRRWTTGLAALLAFVQATGVATYLRAMAGDGSIISFEVEPWAPWAAVAVLPLGTAALVLVATAIDRWGLGAGYSTVIGAPLIAGAARVALDIRSSELELTAAQVFLTIGLATLVAVLAWRMLGREPPFAPEGDRRTAFELPACGLAPIAISASLMSAPTFIAQALTGAPFELLAPGSGPFLIVQAVLVVHVAVALSIAFNLPRRVAAVWVGADAAPSDVAQIRRRLAKALIPSAAFVAAVSLLPYPFASTLGIQVELSGLVVATSVARDLWAEWQFRRKLPDAIVVWPVHRIYAVQPVLSDLAAAGVPAFARGLHHRTLLQFFGPYIPICLMVAAADRERAESIVRARLLGPDRTTDAARTAGPAPIAQSA